MEQQQNLIENPCGCRTGFNLGSFVITQQHRFDEFEIPIAEDVPDETIGRARRLVETIPFNLDREIGGDAGDFPDDPFVDVLRQCCGIKTFDAGTFVHFAEARSVPEFGAEVAIAFHAVRREFDVAALSRHCRQREAQGVGAVFVDQLERVDDIAFGLGHFLAALVAHQCVDVNILERHFMFEVQAHHHHAGDPEEDDVESRDDNTCRIVTRKLRRFIRPAHCRERPEARRKPSVEHVFVTRQRNGLAEMLVCQCLRFRFIIRDKNLAIVCVPCRNAMAPPELARNAPRFNVAHPLEVSLLPVLRDEARVTLLHRCDGGFGKRRGIDVPLVSQKRFDHRHL